VAELDIAALLSRMTVLEAMELVRRLEAAWHIEPAPIVEARPTPRAHPDRDWDPYYFTLVLHDPGLRKTAVVALVREITGLSLEDASDLVNGAPKDVVFGLSIAENKRLLEKFEELGAKAEMK
jgi:large subunit ribosomal protein L7/L12